MRRLRQTQRSDEWFEALYRAEAQTLLYFLARRTADPETALDVWAETLAQAFKGRGSFRGSTDAESAAWLYTIANRQLAGYYRRGYAERAALDQMKMERPPADQELLTAIGEEAGLGSLRSDLRTALDDLAPGMRDAVQARVIDELDYPDVAKRLGTTEATARVRVSRGLSALAARLDQHTLTLREQ